jgi:putative ABC transport system substrate-binding protein
MARQRIEALVVFPEPIFFQNRQKVVALAAKARLPTAYPSHEYPDIGGLLSYGANLEEQHRIAARYVDKILKGAKPGDLAVEQPNAVQLTVNRRTAKTLGIALPRELLVSADKIID